MPDLSDRSSEDSTPRNTVCATPCPRAAICSHCPKGGLSYAREAVCEPDERIYTERDLFLRALERVADEPGDALRLRLIAREALALLDELLVPVNDV